MPNNPEPTPKIFISYAWENQAVAKRLQSELQRDGVEVFVDYEKITGGDSLPQRISSALEWCNTLVLLWSADAVESYYVKQEWSSAFHLQKKIIACVLDSTKLPALLSGNLYLNFTSYETGYAELCRSLGVQPQPPASKPEPPEPPKSKLPPPPEAAPPKRKSFVETLHRKLKPPDPAPVLKPPEVFDETENDDTAATATPSRWSRRKTLVALLVVVAIALTGMKVCQYASGPHSKLAQPDSTGIRQAETPVVPPPQSTEPESTAMKQAQPANMQRSEPDNPAASQSERETPAQLQRPFRDKPAILSEAEVKTMLQEHDFFCKDYDSNKKFNNPQGRGFANHFEKSMRGNLVFDSASDLLWQRSGSPNGLTFAQAEEYVRDLNMQNFVGNNDWRLPTLEEAMSLIEREKNDAGFYINPLFDKKKALIWTADQYSAGMKWGVNFSSGFCSINDVTNNSYVRAVRSGRY